MSQGVIGVQGGYANNVPQYAFKNTDTIFSGTPNILDDRLPHEFSRTTGTQTVTIIRTTAGVEQHRASFRLSGGINANSGGYVGMIDNTAVYVAYKPYLNCSVTYEGGQNLHFDDTRLKVTTNDSGRIYHFAFSPYALKKPTVYLDPVSAPLLTDKLIISAEFVRYMEM
jgi:hypothetical protein